jgi:hypothetical protein
MMQRLGGWQRLGLIISVCWVVGSFIVLRFYTYRQGISSANAFVGLCTSAGKPFDQCWTEIDEYRRIATEVYWPPLLIVSLGPLPLFWLLGWAIIRTTRWIRAGFVTFSNSRAVESARCGSLPLPIMSRSCCVEQPGGSGEALKVLGISCNMRNTKMARPR